MAERSYHVIIIGAGAAGMSAAVAALREMKRRGNRTGRGKVLLLESNDRVGKKILATGNGKCNFTHENIGIEYYHTDDSAVLKSVLNAFPTEAALRFFEEMGMQAKEKNGYFYPLTETASTVLDVLRLRLLELGCETLCGIRVENVEKKPDKGFLITYCEQQKVYRVFADSVILATGSKAGGFLQDKAEDPLRIPHALGLRSTPLYPALTKCVCKEEHYFRQLTGVRAQVKISVYTYADKWKLLGRESGELQLTKEGISGITVFQLSGDIAQKLAEKKRIVAEINFLPGFEEDGLDAWVKDRLLLLPGRTLEDFFLGVLHKKILQVCLQAEGLRGNMQIPFEDTDQSMYTTERERTALSDNKYYLSAEKRAMIMVSDVMKRAMHFSTEVTGVADMRQAQVCRGGLLLSQFDEDLQSREVPGLFACGELLNVDGICGGYNLHFAWASGNQAGRQAARRAENRM